MKVCCLGRGHETCADCPDYPECEIIHGFYEKKGYKYGRYRGSMEFIRVNGYPAFIKIADRWNGPYGKLG